VAENVTLIDEKVMAVSLWIAGHIDVSLGRRRRYSTGLE